MIQSIKNNHKLKLDSKLYYGKYYDFILSDSDAIKQSKESVESLLMADFSQLNIVNGTLYSDSVWGESKNEGIEMFDVGFTTMDNGLISFRKDRVTNSEFLDLYLNSVLNIESGDTRLFLNPVTGNTQMYSYQLYLVNGEDRYLACKGGFYQGFFKLEGFNYQTLPSKVENDWVLSFNLRPRSDYEIDTTNINYIHPENKGIFFFMGTRAENKFWPFYKTNSGLTSVLKKVDAQSEGYFDGCNDDGSVYNVNKNNVVFEQDWLKEEYPEMKEEGYFIIGDGYFAFDENVDINKGMDTSSTRIAPCNENYFEDSYYIDCNGDDNNKAIDDAYIGKDVEIDPYSYTDSEGHELNKKGHFEIETDNKFVMFDRTNSGVTTETWVEGTKVKLTGRKDWPNANYFILMDRTETGYTVDTIDSYNQKNAYDYNIYKDIRNNVFALRINENGGVGYRYGVLNCDENDVDKYEIIEEYSKDGLIKDNEWNTINVRIMYVNEQKMRLFFYVNKFLVFISKELPTLNFKGLDEIKEKQECVPYNISLGGGSLGLLETILPDYYGISDYILPIERDFCGSFIGDIKSFKMYNGNINYSSINNYLS